MRYYLIDRVQYLAKGRHISAIKNVALSEDIFNDHFMGRPVMPGALQIEALAQAGTILLEVSSGLRFKALLIMINNAKFREIVRPGDQLIIEMDVESDEGSIARLKGKIRVKDIVVTDAVLTFAQKDFDDIYDSRLRPYVEIMYSVLLEGATLVDIESIGKL